MSFEDKKTPRLCAKCRNHGEHVLLKGHKIACQYQNCKCPKCLLIEQRRINCQNLKRELTDPIEDSLTGKSYSTHGIETPRSPDLSVFGNSNLKDMLTRNTDNYRIGNKIVKVNRKLQDPPERKSRSKPYCQLCLVHNESHVMKNHKYYCKYKFCECQKCSLIKQRRKIIANQVWLSRKYSQDASVTTTTSDDSENSSTADYENVGSISCAEPPTPSSTSPSSPIFGNLIAPPVEIKNEPMISPNFSSDSFDITPSKQFFETDFCSLMKFLESCD